MDKNGFAFVGPWRGQYWRFDGLAQNELYPRLTAYNFDGSTAQTWGGGQVVDNLDVAPDLNDTPSEALNWEPPSSAEFRKRVEKARTIMAKSKLKKVVPCVFERRPQIPSFNERRKWWRRCLNTHANQVAFAWWNSRQGVVGQSPEVLFELQGPTLKTMALAGTAAVERSDEDFLNDPKERAEHEFVVKDLHSKLEDFGPLSFGVTQILRLPKIKHLTTSIQCDLKQSFSADQIVKALHPTAALGGYPRAAAQMWLREQDEFLPRGVFGAPLVLELSLTEAIAIVTLRCVQWDQTQTKIYSGCGIVSESRWESEWNELNLKRQTVKESLGI